MDTHFNLKQINYALQPVVLTNQQISKVVLYAFVSLVFYVRLCQMREKRIK